MVVLAASICTRGGKAILSRQFRDLHKDRVTALLANFPKLTQSGTQHTTVEDDNVRYVYQPVEELYVVLITNRQSNILQDIGTLRLLAQIVSSTVRTVDEREILLNAFELLSAFDEVVSLGYRENLSLAQIKTFLEMESHEEKIQEIIERNKELEAAEERKKKAKQLEMQRREVSRRGGAGGVGGAGGFNSGGYGGGAVSPFGSSLSGQNQSSTASRQSPSTVYNSNDYEAQKPTKSVPPRGKGLQLGSKKKSIMGGGLDSEASPLMATPVDDPLEYKPPPARETPSETRSAPSAAAANVSTNKGVELTVSETISARLRRDGSVASSEVKGSLGLRIADPNLSSIQVVAIADGPDSLYKTNPNVDKSKFVQQRLIAPRDSRPFPSNNNEIPVLRWKVAGKPDDVSLVPIVFSCWLSKSDPGFFDVTIECELNSDFEDTLENVVVSVPLVSSNAHITDPSLVWDQFDDHVEWMIPEIKPGTSSQSFEFTAEADSEDDFFPMSVQFRILGSASTFGKVDVSDVIKADETSVPFEKIINRGSESYEIV